MTAPTVAEIAERRTRKRARILFASAAIFLIFEVSYYGQFGTGRAVDQIKVAAWLVWSAALLIVLATGGGFLQRREVRALMNDESTRAHRADAFAWGFWAAMIGGILLYVATMFDATVTTRDVIHLILTFGTGAAILRFAVLERRALSDG